MNSCNKIKLIAVYILTVSFLVTGVFPVNAATKSSKSKTETESTDETKAIEKSKEETKDSKEYKVEYTLYVNRAKNFVRVTKLNPLGQEVRVKVMKCSVGRTGHATPKGTFKTSDYYEWRLMVDNTYAQYAVRFNKHIMFHSVPYYKRSPDTLEWEQYNLLGKPASLGCIRLTVADAKWIYDYCKKGTKVVVYDDVSEDIEVPATRTISAGSTNRDWDPTDPDINNPWND